MISSALHLILAQENRPGRFTLTANAFSYTTEFHPETDVALGDLLRRLPPVLDGGNDPSGRLTPPTLVREIGTRLWQIKPRHGWFTNPGSNTDR